MTKLSGINYDPTLNPRVEHSSTEVMDELGRETKFNSMKEDVRVGAEYLLSALKWATPAELEEIADELRSALFDFSCEANRIKAK